MCYTVYNDKYLLIKPKALRRNSHVYCQKKNKLKNSTSLFQKFLKKNCFQKTWWKKICNKKNVDIVNKVSEKKLSAVNGNHVTQPKI